MKGLILIYLITGVGSIAALRVPLVGLAIYIGFAVLRPQFIWGFAGGFEGISRWIGVATLIGWALNGCGSLKLGRGRSIVISLALFAIWTVVSATQAIDQNVGYAELSNIAKYTMPFFIGVTIIDSEKWPRIIMWVIVLAQGYVGFELNTDYWLRGFNFAGEGFGGMDNNCFGVALVSTIGPAIALGLGAKTWRGRAMAAIAAALILHTTLLTFSRGAMVGLLVVGATAFVIMPKRPKYIAVLAVTGLIALRLTGPQLASRYATAMAQEEERDASAESRIDLWMDCLKVTGERPIFGVGPGNFKVVAESLGWPPGKQAHTTWLQTAAENGIPGVTFLLFVFGFAIVKLWPLARARLTEENRYEVSMATGILLCIVGFVVSGQFVSLGGLEIPYYTTMVAVALLKKTPAPVAVRATPPVPNRVHTWSGRGRPGPAPVLRPQRHER